MTKAEAWERFGQQGGWCGVSGSTLADGFTWQATVGVLTGEHVGTGPTPEAAIAAAFGETLEDDAR